MTVHYTNNNLKNRLSGFTLIELLIVIAILGVLAVVVLLALNPVQQLARTRDAGRISTITQVGHALEAFATNNNGTYVPEGNTWVTALQQAGEISQVPTNPTYTAPAAAGSGKATPTNCSGAPGVQGGFCYNAASVGGGAPAVAYVALESQAQNSRCPGTQIAFAAYSTEQGRGGIVCAATYATVLSNTGLTFLP